MRDAAFACIRRVGVETGGSNVQFAVDPDTGEQVVIEMNPRVSRSSALASKATGFPIAKIAAKLAVGYTLDEIPNDITMVVDAETGAVIRSTPASFEPVIDYVVTKVPRWAFEKLPGAEPRLGHPDAVGGRGDGHRADVPRVAPEGAPLARARPRGSQRRSRPRSVVDAVSRPATCWSGPERELPSGSSRSSRCCAVVFPSTRCTSPRGSIRWFLDQILAIVEERRHLESKGTGPAVAGGVDRPGVAASQAARLR